MAKKLFATLLFLSYFCLIFFPTVILAADPQGQTYKEQTFMLNVPIGTLTSFPISQSSNNILGLYIKAWYGFLIGTVGIIAAVMIMYGGIKFLSSRGDNTQISNARETIISAITGLVLAFGSYTILSIVSPNLLTIHVPALPRIQDTSGIDMSKQESAAATGSSSQGNGSISSSGGNSSGMESTVRTSLNDVGIKVVSTGNCSDCNNATCTCVGGLTQNAADRVMDLAAACPNCQVDITGATETGHHYGCGGNCIDLQRNPGQTGYDNLDNYIGTNGTRVTNGGARGYDCTDATPCYQINNDLYYQENSAHWHAHYNYF